MKIKRTRLVTKLEENHLSINEFWSKYMFVSKEWPLINVYDLPCWIQDSFCLSKKYPSWQFCKIIPYNINKKNPQLLMMPLKFGQKTPTKCNPTQKQFENKTFYDSTISKLDNKNYRKLKNLLSFYYLLKSITSIKK